MAFPHDYFCGFAFDPVWATSRRTGNSRQARAERETDGKLTQSRKVAKGNAKKCEGAPCKSSSVALRLRTQLLVPVSENSMAV